MFIGLNLGKDFFCLAMGSSRGELHTHPAPQNEKWSTPVDRSELFLLSLNLRDMTVKYF